MSLRQYVRSAVTEPEWMRAARVFGEIEGRLAIDTRARLLPTMHVVALEVHVEAFRKRVAR